MNYCSFGADSDVFLYGFYAPVYMYDEVDEGYALLGIRGSGVMTLWGEEQVLRELSDVAERGFKVPERLFDMFQVV